MYSGHRGAFGRTGEQGINKLKIFVTLEAYHALRGVTVNARPHRSIAATLSVISRGYWRISGIKGGLLALVGDFHGHVMTVDKGEIEGGVTQ